MDNLKELEVEVLEARKAEIANEIEAPDADLDALKEEARAIREELERRKAEEAKKVEIRNAVATGSAEVEIKETISTEERKKPTMDEIRNSKEYVDAYARYLLSGKDEECRALLSENATSGTIPVPELVYDIVKTAWDNEGITRRVRKAYIKGNLKVSFEMSADAAVIHPEGHTENEEALVLGTVNIVPETIMKWISISKEAESLSGEGLIRYIYDELTYQIAKKAANEMVAKIVACGTVSTTTCPSVPTIVSTTASVGLIANAIGMLSDEARNPVVIMNKASWASFKAAQYAGQFNVDPFEGLDVEFNNSLKAIGVASTGDTWAIVGDLDHGALMTLPNGDNVDILADRNTLATSGLIRYVGDMLTGLAVVADKAFVKITK